MILDLLSDSWCVHVYSSSEVTSIRSGYCSRLLLSTKQVLSTYEVRGLTRQRVCLLCAVGSKGVDVLEASLACLPVLDAPKNI